MATKTSKNLTLADWAKRKDPNGDTSQIVELLSETNEIIMDMPFIEANGIIGHTVTQRTGLPASTYRKMNQGVPPAKSKTAQITEAVAMLSSRMEIDKDEAELGGDVAGYLESETVSFTESMNQTFAEKVFYGSSTSPEEIVGFAERYNDLNAPNGQNILDAGGAGSDNASIWLMGWSDRTVAGVFPKGSKAGLNMEDLGVIDAFDEDNNRFRAYSSVWDWKHGIALEDWRYVVRIANVDISDLKGQTGTQAATAATAIIKLMTQAQGLLPRLSGVKLCYYAPRAVCNMLRVAAQDKSSNVLDVEKSTNQFGQDIFTLRFMGAKVGIVDALLTNEARVVGS